MSALHDLFCKRCGTERENVVIVGGKFPVCCGVRMKWIPRGFATDVAGSEQVSSGVLVDPDHPDQPLRWTSTRERDQKMKRWGCEPVGDRVHGALGSGGPPTRRRLGTGARQRGVAPPQAHWETT